MTTKQKIANKEILIVLSKLNLVDKIPKDIISSMQNNQDENWNFVYIDNVPLDKQKLTRQSIIMFSNLYYMYICKDNTERQKIKDILQENEKRQYEEMTDRLNNLNRRESYTIKTTNIEEEKKQLVEVKKESFIKKIINIIKSLFHKYL